jgi:Bax protein
MKILYSYIAFFTLIPALLCLGGCHQSSEPRDARNTARNTIINVSPTPPPSVEQQPEKAAPVDVSPDSLKDLERLFALNNYDLDTLHEHGVPKIIIHNLPEDLKEVGAVSEKKRLFFLTLLPMILMANEEIQAERDTLISLFDSFDQGKLPGALELERLASIQRRYKIKGDPLMDEAVRQKLLTRVDILPPSLVLAQAANESAWGTSRFARLANNIFGEWTFTPGTGIVPKDRPEGASYEVRKFPSIYDSLKSYMANLNTNGAYAPLRRLRAQMRRQDEPLQGTELAKGLLAYSTRREAYVAEIAEMIRYNRLNKFSQASLRGS